MESQVSSPRQEIKREVVELIRMVLLFLVLFWGLKTFVVEGYEVWGPSMLPTLEEGQRILVFKLPHELSRLPLFRKLEALKPGDIVVFDSASEGGKRYVKRIIARGPNRAGSNTVDAQAREGANFTSSGTKVVFEQGRVYVDNHIVKEDYLTSAETRSPDCDKVVLSAGEYYVLGDHRSVSKDSRDFGPIRDEQIVGRAVLRFWPLKSFGLL